MSKPASEIVAKSQAKNREAGGGRLTFNLSPSEMAEWERLRDQVGSTQKAALMHAVRAGLGCNDLTPEQVAEWVLRQGRRPD